MHIESTKTSSYTMMYLNDYKNKELEFIEKEKDLGIIFDNNLKFSSHIIIQINYW